MKIAKQLTYFSWQRKPFVHSKLAFAAVMAIFMLSPIHAAPSISGVPGLVRIPSADFAGDGVIIGGAHLIPRQALRYSHYNNDGLVLFASMTFLPFIEFDLRLTKQLGKPPSQRHTVDRSPGFRIKLLRDKGINPAVVLGFHDIFSTVKKGEARHFAATYVVASKILKIGNVLITPTLGYGLDIIPAADYEFVGLIGGVKCRLYKHPNFALCLDYDSQFVNVGFDASLLNFLTLKIAVLEMQYFSFGTSMQFDLFDVF